MLLGIDGGGTKTTLVLCADDGRQVSRLQAGPTNPNGQERMRAQETLREALHAILPKNAPCYAFAGIAGCASAENRAAMEQVMGEMLPAGRYRVDSDTVNALSSGIGVSADGVIVIAGTGSSCFARKNGTMLRTGGWGYLFGDPGSGYAIGNDALRLTMRAEDGLCAESMLTRLVTKQLGGKPSERLAHLYAEGRTCIASFAPCVGEAYLAGDPNAEEILASNARLLGEQLRTALARVPGTRAVLTGSIITHMPSFRERLMREAPNTQYIWELRENAYGAVFAAAQLAGIPVGAVFDKQYDSTDRGQEQ